MKIKQLIKRLNEIVEANPNNSELEVKALDYFEHYLVDTDGTECQIVYNPTEHSPICLLNHSDGDCYFPLQDDGSYTDKCLTEIGEYLGRNTLSFDCDDEKNFMYSLVGEQFTDEIKELANSTLGKIYRKNEENCNRYFQTHIIPFKYHQMILNISQNYIDGIMKIKLTNEIG